ncbi:AAA domain-containing protein [Polluticaenibacter yanchengensis]|uniref:AAA domain-containing protein n=1 Tax=Polluticaenibacter yanchengensis TaxID=3014562 RepID=A0ABT4UNC3_9BACT|nr:AAA domain-containing protein [Chitinophagaceae bacterium LY-5]
MTSFKMTNITIFTEYIAQLNSDGKLTSDDILHLCLPLLEEVASFHDEGLVGPFENTNTVFHNGEALDIDENYAHAPINNLHAVIALLAKDTINGFKITDRILNIENLETGTSDFKNLNIGTGRQDKVYPAFLPGYQCYEMLLEHHDSQTDIFCLGLILASLITNLDFNIPEDLEEYIAVRHHTHELNTSVHPTIHRLVLEMTALDRNDRARDLNSIITQLKNYRDFTLTTNIETISTQAPVANRNQYILGKLKNRLFDTSRRNRLVYYKPNSRFVNLTISSVPNVLHFQSIKANTLFTWNEHIQEKIIKMQDLHLNKYLRFEDHPYLNTQLNQVRLIATNDEKEFGFSQLRLVISFLNWYNFKEDAKERIQSPLLLLPVELKKRKNIKDESYTLSIDDNTAIVNPVLAFMLNDLYGITLPETLTLTDQSVQEFYKQLQAIIEGAGQGIKLNYIDQPRIKIIHNEAKRAISLYSKKLRSRSKAYGVKHINYSYDHENFMPLGLEIFRQKIQPDLNAFDHLFEKEQPSAPAPDHFSDSTLQTNYQISDGEINPYIWEFDTCNFVLGNFNYKKMSLVSDYNTVAATQTENAVFNELFSNEPKKTAPSPKEYNVSEWFHVITADPTQTQSVLRSREGESYIIQGPPGTGKSQTITNLIADFLANGKSVLFICEKRAALDVVYHRLQQNHLADLCCYIHDSQSDKKSFIQNLKTVYETFINEPGDIETIRNNRQAIVNKLQQALDTLANYHNIQSNVQPQAGIKTYELLEKVLTLKSSLPELSKENVNLLGDYSDWVKFGEVLTQLSQDLKQLQTPNNSLNQHPFAKLSQQLINSDQPFQLVDNITANILQSFKNIDTAIHQNGIPASLVKDLQSIQSLFATAAELAPLANTNNIQIIDAKNPVASQYQADFHLYQQVKNKYNNSSNETANWVHKIPKSDIQPAIDIANRYEHSFFKFLNGKWRQLKKVVTSNYNFNAHSLKPDISTILQQLKTEYELADQLAEKQSYLEQKYQFTNLTESNNSIQKLREKLNQEDIRFFINHADGNNLVKELIGLNAQLQILQQALQSLLYNYQSLDIDELKAVVSKIQLQASDLKLLLPSLQRLSDLPVNIQKAVRELPLNATQLESAMANKTMQYILDAQPQFATQNFVALQQAVSEVHHQYNELLKINAVYIKAVRRQQFIANYNISNASVTQLSDEQKEIKKIYAEGRKVLEHEMSKTMRYKSIREIAGGASGRVLKDVKPVWLMSPLSVSDSLPLESDYFDVVIYDEASQITLEEGIPALFRAPQVIIVGDDKQMPPSNFFNAKSEDADDLSLSDIDLAEADHEGLFLDAESLLDQGARKLQNTMLQWHYRSRYETLIAYSNHAFYGTNLLTIPDKTIHQNAGKEIVVLAPEKDAAVNAGQLLNTSISFHYFPNSVYEARSNNQEATYIAYLVKELLTKNIDETIGIVAFSMEQQSIIEEAIDHLAEQDKGFDALLEKAYNRVDNNQHTGLFVKNLENVQGDERDIIIMSICYGPDAQKKTRMNFGPINRKGGEKRLNVIFSRAKKHMAVISSLKHHDITNEHNDGANFLKLFLQYAEMVGNGQLQNASLVLNKLNPNTRTFSNHHPNSSATARQIKASLEAKGYIVDENIGQSHFKCHLGIKKTKEDNMYFAGILVDDQGHYNNKNPFEQYYQKPNILIAFGWKIIPVLSKDWLLDQDLIMNHLISELK